MDTPQPGQWTDKARSYRCVCGNLVALEGGAEAELSCSQCGRAVGVGYLGDAEGDETILATISEEHGPASAANEGDLTDVPQQWGHFRILEPLGRGGMGTVYRALDESLQRYVALKVITGSGSGAEDPKQVQQLFQEARAQARVNHPHIVHIYFVGTSHGSPYFAMELVNGVTLKDRLANGPLPFAEVVEVGLQVAAALQHALKFEIVHGDIKPSNLLYTEAGEVKISDFGLAKTLSELESREGVLAGTPDYISPEGASRSSTDFRSDFYSLGVTLFELTFGKLPYHFGTKTVEERLEAHQERPIEFPLEWPKSVPEAWRAVLERLLQKKPELRYTSYEALLKDLEAVRPSGLITAGLIPRGFAWFTDVLGLFLLTALIHFPIKYGPLIDRIGESPLLERLIPVLALFGVPIIAIGYQWSRGTTPGKKLFQLRLVDQHGASPTRAQVGIRTGMQYMVLWLSSIFGFIEAYGTPVDDKFIISVILVPVLVEMGFVLFSRHRLALHDRLMGTRVVVDTRDLNQ